MQPEDHSAELGPDDRRYEFERKLGEGGAGSVYLVRDRETGERFALKRLHRVDDRSVHRLKREFRSLANINHRNVIKLYDLGRSADAWFLTMEYLDGVDLLDYLEPDTRTSATIRGARPVRPVADALDVSRVARAFHQLASGVIALHQAGVLHRDLKPSNVIVAQDRVVVVDFGLALELGEHAPTITMDGLVAGTPAYMAPEQVQGRDWGEPNDWYSFGVMLYEALSGFLPIEGRLHELLRRKLEVDPAPLEELVNGVPPALSELCKRLLSRQPELRPTAAEILPVLQACSTPSEASQLRATPELQPFMTTRQRLSEPWIFGRDDERERLTAALDQVERGGFAVVHVCGLSGAGKSVLVERFLEELAQRGPAHEDLMILRSRCYEREQVPFKALDAAMDALVTQLSREDDLEVGHVLPREIQLLTQLFPALTRLGAVQRLIDPKQPLNTARQARERADSALRELFERLGTRHKVVLWIDDLHWGDLDSGRILKSWMETASLTGLMLILSYRSDEVSTSPCLRLLSDGAGSIKPEDVIAVGPLGDEHIRALCQDRFQHSAQAPELMREIVEHIVAEAQGSPFLASQLSALALSELSESGVDPLEILTIEQLVSRRTALLSLPARRLLHVLSAASRPLPVRLALQLAAAAQESRAALHELSGLGLIRTRDVGPERMLEIYHDRLREAVLARLEASERAALDRELLLALEGEGATDAAWLHALALGAGDRPAALRYGIAAAERASSALAFEFAAELYRTCLDLDVHDLREQCALWQRLALALAHSGHGFQAANAYLEAARRSQGADAVKLKRQAASHFLRSGRFEQGEALITEVLAALQIDIPSTTAGLFAAIGWERARAAVRGLRFTPRAKESVSFERYYGGVLCGTLSIETQIYAPIRAALLQARCLRMALDSGVPELIARALCVSATMTAVTGGGPARADAQLARASEIASTLNSPLVENNINSARAIVAYLRTRMSDAVEYADACERSYRSSSSDEGEYYHRITVVAARTSALLVLGRHEEANAALQEVVTEARDTENINALLTLSALRTRVDLGFDRAHEAKARLELEQSLLPGRPHFGLLHIYQLSSVFRIGCATRDYAWAMNLAREGWARFQRSIFKRAGMFAVIMPAMHARFTLNEGLSLKEPLSQLAARVAPDLEDLANVENESADAIALRIRGRLAYLAGDRPTAVELFKRCMTVLDKDPIAADEAARDRYAYATLLGGEVGAAQQTAAVDTLRRMGFVNPLSDIAAYFPELFPAA